MRKTLTYFCLLMVVSCTNSLPPEEYIHWCLNPENGLSDKSESNPFIFELQYKPAPLVALQNSGGEVQNGLTFKEELKELEKFEFFNFRISTTTGQDFLKTGIKDQQEYFQRVAYYSSFAQPDFVLVTGSDTVSCVMYQFDRNYGISPYQTILLGFKTGNNKNKISDKKLIYHDRILDIPSVEMEISSKSIKQIPNLKL
ncbi:MAG: hypothetical protein RLP14_08055 [Owenweeksia sp.]